ncbi:hypothetical protein [Mesobacillus zeae]|uniref:hypothetical protein n=1 Tax=Mesobacillus zeae TaxID=1917180 RepID=UPI0015E6E367|nr:hypothetical protein [Mesobacillus zeae]
MSTEEQLAFQKLVIREEYKDLAHIIPARDKAQKQVDRTARQSLKRFKRND